jgi:hypothetical protein
MNHEIELNAYEILENSWNWDDKTILWAEKKIEGEGNDKNSSSNIRRERQPSLFKVGFTKL